MIRRTDPRSAPVDPDALAALVARVHPPVVACVWCGATSSPPLDDSGFGTCARCATGVDRWGSTDWPIAAALDPLDVQPSETPSLAWGSLTVPAYRDRGRPGEIVTAWGHLSTIDRADLLDQVRTLARDAARYRNGGPCSRCGAALSSEWQQGPENRPVCAVCADDGASGARSADAVACDLLGLYRHQGAPETLGFRWWADTATPIPSTPWGYLDLDALHRRAVDRYPLRGEWHRPPEDLPVPGPAYMAPARVDGGPCAWCGTTASVWWWTADRGPCCHGCDEDRLSLNGKRWHERDHRNRVAARLARLRGDHDDAADALGFRFYFDTPKAEVDPRRFGYLDVSTLRTRAEVAYLAGDLHP